MGKADTQRLAETMLEEAARAHDYLSSKGRPRAFYVSHLVRDEDVFRVEARFGTEFSRRRQRTRNCYTDVRVGSYGYDQVQEGGLHDNSKEDESYGHVDLPTGGAVDGLRHALWKLTDARYREAVEAFLRKRADELTYVNRYSHLPSFEKRPAVRSAHYARLPEPDEEGWSRYVRSVSSLLKRFPRVKMGSVLFEAANVTKIFASSEGTLRVACTPFWLLECYVWFLSEKGVAFPWTIQHYVTDPEELPDRRGFGREVRAAIELLAKLAEAPKLQSFSGPVLLDPRPAGLLVHEALGHRLEGNRLLSTGEGQTFRDSVGKQVLPPGLSVRDDPNMARHGGRSLVGHYVFDDEGVDAKSANLIERGKLKGFLTSRAGIRKRHVSNGHARNSRHERPISRMAVTVVECDDGLPEAELRARLLEEIRRQKAPFGIRVLRCDSGETATEGYNFQAFLGEINLAARVFPDGRQEWIRGVNFIGTPLNAVRSIVAAGRRQEVDNAQCGAESGYVPVSTISPALLVSRLELQSKSEASYAQYSYPIPWDSD